MRILIDDLVVIFPYQLVFNQQVEYMTSLKRTLDAQGHGLLEMPTGTGKTVCLLSLLVAYISQRKRYKKIVYCTRTVVEMEKTLNELKKLLKKVEEEDPQCKKLLATGLTAKKNLCIHKHVDVWKSNEKVDEQCKKRTSQWVRAKMKGNIDEEQSLCVFYQNYRENPNKLKAEDSSAVFTMQDLRTFGGEHIRCPYYTARDGLENADIVVFNYLYLIDAKISGDIIKKLSKDSIVVFDEAHNIDDICIQAYTVRINRGVLRGAYNCIHFLRQRIQSVQDTNIKSFKEQCRVVMSKINEAREQTTKLNTEAIAVDRNKIIPPSILNSDIFLDCLEIIIKYFTRKLQEKVVTFTDPKKMIADIIYSNVNISDEFLLLSSEKLRYLTNALEISEMNFFRPLEVISDALSRLASTTKGFKIVFEPNHVSENFIEPALTIACTDASIAMAPVFRNFPSVILTSGTISPLELYPKLLNFKPVTLKSIDIELTRNSIQPMIIASTTDSTPISSEYVSRSNRAVTRNFANLLLSLCDVVPDGILCFFPSYKYMEHVLKQWAEEKFIDQIIDKRYIFVESKDPLEAAEQLTKYRKACDIGRGAIFLAIARGKIAEGIDFEQHYGRCVIMIGFPVQNSHELVLLERIKYMVEQRQVKDKNEFLEFDTMRQCAQCLGRVMRKKTDYGLMILADVRFNSPGKYHKLPLWIRKALHKDMIDVTMEAACALAGKFFREMGKPFVLAERLFKREEFFREAVLSQEEINRKKKELEKEDMYEGKKEEEKKEKKKRKRQKRDRSQSVGEQERQDRQDEEIGENEGEVGMILQGIFDDEQPKEKIEQNK